jgi:hypothetical protein
MIQIDPETPGNDEPIKLKRIVPQEVYQVKAWLLAGRRFDESNFMGEMIDLAADEEKLVPDQARRLSALLMEYLFAAQQQTFVFHF